MLYMLIIAGGFIIAAIVVVIVLSRHGHKKNSPKGSEHVLAADLRDEKLKSELILKAIEDGVMLLDDQKTIQAFNPAAGVMTGWDPKEAMGLNYKIVLELIDNKGVKYDVEADPFEKAYSSKTTVRDQKANLNTRAKTIVSLDITVSPLFDSANNVRGAVAVFRDVSEERKEGQQRAEFVSTASHEMRTPVAAIEGYLALALNDKVSTIDSKARNFLEKAHESTQHLGQLFQDLLTSAKAEDGRLTNHPSVVEVSAFLESLTDGLKFAAQKKTLAVEFVLGAPNSVIDASGGNVLKPLYYVHVDPDRLREVITNIFDNAVKYTDTGKITIGLTGDTNVVQLRVSDTGHGIPTQDVPHLFEKFYRVDNSNTRTVGGTGLGLFICRKIIELYNGRIWVESEADKGSTFYINLPRLSSDHAQTLLHEEAAKSSILTDGK
jgi:PAS domain S-box-containing protein